MNLTDGNVSQFLTVLVSDAIDQQGMSPLIAKLQGTSSTLFNVGDINHVPLPAVAVQPLAFAWVIDNILG